jgi:hypothetical protein
MKADTITVTDAQSTGLGEFGPDRPPPGPVHGRRVAAGWWLAAIAYVAVAAVMTVVVAWEADISTAPRAAAGATTLLVVAAVAVSAHVILRWYEGPTIDATGSPSAGRRQTVFFLKTG